MKVLVTGGAGFIGSHLVERLFKEGHRVTVLDNLYRGKIANLYDVIDNINFIEGDVRNSEHCHKACKDQDYVFHLAALASVPESMDKPHEYFLTNQLGTMNMLEAASSNKVKKLIFASSGSVYGDTSFRDLKPDSFYAQDKLNAEGLCLRYHNSLKLEVGILRYFNVFGPRDSRGLISKIIDRIICNKPVVVCGEGRQKRSYVSVHNIVDANIQLMTDADTRSVTSPVWDVSGADLTVLDVISKIEDHVKCSLDKEFVKRRPGDVAESISFTPNYIKLIVGFDDALRELLKEKGLCKNTSNSSQSS